MEYTRHAILTLWEKHINELWSKRELFYYLVWRDFKVRYKQARIGIFWVILQPFLTMVVFSFIFGNIAKIATGNIPYPIYIYTGLLFWNLFAKSVSSCSESLLANQQLVKKVAFPRIFLPVSTVFINLIDFIFAALVLVGLMIYYRFAPHYIGLPTFPFFALATVLLAVGIGLPLAILNVYFRDVRFMIPYALQLLLFLTPVLYSAEVFARWPLILFFNPLSGIIASGRALILGQEPFLAHYFWFSLLTTVFILITGVFFFRSREKQIADLL